MATLIVMDRSGDIRYDFNAGDAKTLLGAMARLVGG